MIPDQLDYARQVAVLLCPFCGGHCHLDELRVFPPLEESLVNPDQLHVVLCAHCFEKIIEDHLENCVEYRGWSRKWDDERQEWTYTPPLETFESMDDDEVPLPPMFQNTIGNRGASDDC